MPSPPRPPRHRAGPPTATINQPGNPTHTTDTPASAAHSRYRRAQDLPRLISIWPHELDETDRAQREAIVARLRAALRAERRRGLAGHWTYDLSRHNQLLTAYRAEAAALAQMPPRS